MNKLESSAIRYFVSIVLVALGLYFGYEVITISNASSSHVSGGVAVKPMVLANGTVMVTGGRKTVCSGKHSHTKIVTIYEGDPRLEMKMYTFTQDDLSAEVLAHAAKKVRGHACTRACAGPCSNSCTRHAASPSCHHPCCDAWRSTLLLRIMLGDQLCPLICHLCRMPRMGIT